MNRLYTILFVFLSFSATGQHEANVWVFDRNLIIDFNGTQFQSYNTQVLMDQVGASASICDSQSGQLLFFTNGRDVWNRTHRFMQNGRGLRGGKYASQAVFVIPRPGDPNKYYIFTTKSMDDPYPEGQAGVYYSMVDMQLDNGLGGIIPEYKNIPLLANASDKLTAIPQENNLGYWLITHEGDTDRFVVFSITSSGIGSPTHYSFGLMYDYHKSRGWLQASPNGQMIACAVSSDGIETNPMELYDFDTSTGAITNRRVLGNFAELTGVSFSPDNSKLYFTDANQNDASIGMLYQVDLSRGSDEETIASTLIRIYALHDPLPDMPTIQYDTIGWGVLQLAPDGRLYMKAIVPYSELENGTLVTKRKIYYLDKPNLAGLDCEPRGRDFDARFSGTSGWAFPNYPAFYFNNLEPVNNDEGNDHCTQFNTKVYPNPTDGLATIQFDNSCDTHYSIRLYGMTTQLLRDVVMSGHFYTLDLRDVSAGLYILQIKPKHGASVVTHKIIKR